MDSNSTRRNFLKKSLATSMLLLVQAKALGFVGSAVRRARKVGLPVGIWSWGTNTWGQLGNNNVTTYSSPIQVIATADWAQISAGSFSTIFAVKNNGTLWGWGRNNSGLLCNGQANNPNIPKQLGSDTTWNKVFTGVSNFFTIKSDNTLWAWGSNSFGTLGSSNSNVYRSPTKIGSISIWADISHYNAHTVGLRTDGSLWAWGQGYNGARGDGTSNNVSAPVRVGTLNTWQSMSAGSYYTLAKKTDGTLWAWGDNTAGKLGLGHEFNCSTPVQVGSGTTWSKVFAGYDSTFAIKADGSLWAWGYNGSCQLGLGDFTNRSSPVQVGLDSWLTIQTVQNVAHGIRSDGTLWTWGDGVISTPVQVGSDSDWVDVQGASGSHIALKSNGTIWSWGLNEYGQLGLGITPKIISTPVQIGTATNWVAISSRSNSVTGAKKSDGTFWLWGYVNTTNAILGHPADVSSPIQIGSASDWAKVYSGTDRVAAIKTNGTLWAWGAYQYDSQYLSYSSPVQLDSGTSWTHVSVNSDVVLARKSDGTIWVQGCDSNSGSLGLDTNYFASTLTQVGSDTDWASVYESVAIKTNGTAWGWGNNNNGLLGLGHSSTPVLTPVQIGTSSNWVKLSRSSMILMGLKSDGTLWGAGYNALGALGTGDRTTYSTLTQALGSNWSDIAAGARHCLAIKSDKTLWAWGLNSWRQLGTNNSTNYSSPVQIGSHTNWALVSAGEDFSLGVKKNS